MNILTQFNLKWLTLQQGGGNSLHARYITSGEKSSSIIDADLDVSEKQNSTLNQAIVDYYIAYLYK